VQIYKNNEEATELKHLATENSKLLEGTGKQELMDLRNQVKDWDDRFQADDPTIMTGMAFVCFNKGIYRDEIYNTYKKTGFWYDWFGIGSFFNHRIFVHLPDEPNDVLWEALSYTEGNRWIRKSLSYILGVIIICAGFIGLYYLKTEKVNFFFKNFFRKFLRRTKF